MSSRTLVVFGSGPGIGNHVAADFALKGFNHIILLARNSKSLASNAEFVKSKAPDVKVDTLSLDLSDLSAIPPTLKKIEELSSGIEVVFFNAAVIKPTPVLEVPTEELELDYRVTNLALYIIAQWAVPKLQAAAKANPSAKPSLFVTSSHLPWDPLPALLSLSMVKASQRVMVMSLHRAYADSGVHFGLIYVQGAVAPENPNLNPKNIAQKTIGLYEDGKALEVSIKE